MTITLQTLNLSDAERVLCEQALRAEGTLVGAAERLGITRHSLKRRILKHNILWPIPRTGIRPGMFDPDPLITNFGSKSNAFQPKTDSAPARPQSAFVPQVSTPPRTVAPTVMGANTGNVFGR